jgi:ferredoxin
MKAHVDPELCTGCGPCEEICPEVFEVKQDVATVKCDVVPEDAEVSCRQAAEECPTEAISLKT